MRMTSKVSFKYEYWNLIVALKNEHTWKGQKITVQYVQNVQYVQYVLERGGEAQTKEQL